MVAAGGSPSARWNPGDEMRSSDLLPKKPLDLGTRNELAAQRQALQLPALDEPQDRLIAHLQLRRCFAGGEGFFGKFEFQHDSPDTPLHAMFNFPLSPKTGTNGEKS